MDPDGSIAEDFQAEHGRWEVREPTGTELKPRLAESDGVRGPAGADGYVTPAFGTDVAKRLEGELGTGKVLVRTAGVYPAQPLFVSTERNVVRCCPALVKEVPFPELRTAVPFAMERIEDKPGIDSRHRHYVIRWKTPVKFRGEDEARRTRMWSVSMLGEERLGGRLGPTLWVALSGCLRQRYA